MQDEVHKRALEREFITDGLFLETYSGLGALVLGLDPDEGEYLFGVRNRKLRQALLEVVHEEGKTVDGLASSHGLDRNIIQAVLNATTFLFVRRPNGCFGTIWSAGAETEKGKLINTLEVQRLRSITRHFDAVAVTCGAWRGKATQSTAAATRPERFYLPTENAVYSEFFETSRILARERYATEIAERLIFRLCHGLTYHCDPPLSLDEVDVLACSTTPSVMLAGAIRRAWPVGRDDKRPVVIDYGPSLFSGADPAQILGVGDTKPHVVIVHDLFDEGRLSSQLVDLIKKQNGQVLFVLSFVRFIPPNRGKERESTPFPLDAGWQENSRVGKPVHALIGLPRPSKMPRESVTDWGVGDGNQDQIVDPRALRPVPLRALRLESRYSQDRSLTKRDSCLREFDTDGGRCRLAAGHYVYGQRHFAVVVDVRGLLTGSIGHRITNWLADVCCNNIERNAPWEDKRNPPPEGEVSVLLLPLHSQIHYVLPGLQMELAQRGRRVPHFFLDATSYGGGVEKYDVPYQLRTQITRAAEAIKALKEDKNAENQDAKISAAQLRILLIDDAIFSAKTLQTLLDSLAQQCEFIKRRVYGHIADCPNPIGWVRAFAVLNQLPIAQSALWHQLSSCPASPQFRFDEYAPFIGAATFSAQDCPACSEAEQLEYVEHRVEGAGATDALIWVQKRRQAIAPLSTEAPSFRNSVASPLPEPIDVLALRGEAAPDRYKPMYADSAIWRFYELMHLSYPLGDILACLQSTREAGKKYSAFRAEYARFRLAVYDWCIRTWHRVRLYNLDEQILGELKSEVKGGESIFIEVIYRLSGVLPDETVSTFVKWAIDFLAEEDCDSRRMVSDSALALDSSLTLLFLALRRTQLKETGLLEYLGDKQARASRKSSFLALLYLRLTRPTRVADPSWALNTIAETCFRGQFGDTAEERRTSDHELLGRIAAATARKPGDQEVRRRLEGSLHAFIAAGENLQPYFDQDLLSTVMNPAGRVLEWLRLPLPDALADITPVKDLSVSMQSSESWAKFAEACHMSAADFAQKLKARLAELREAQQGNRYEGVELKLEVQEEVQEWCLMSHIPRLIACLSNIALEPVTEVKPTQASRIVCKPCEPARPQSITIEVTTYFGAAPTSREAVAKSPKIAHSLDGLRSFGVSVEGPAPVSEDPDNGLRISFIVPVGFQ